MANISSFFGGSGGSGLSTDFTKNDYGVPLPEYITCMAHKSSCTITVCPGYTFCSDSRGFSQGGIVNVKDNIFIATGVEHPFGNDDCTKVFAMAFCVNDDTGAICSNMTEFKCIFQSASTNDRFAGQSDTSGVGDGDCRAYYGYSCSSNGHFKIVCTNNSFNCIGTSAGVTYTQSSAGSGAKLVYNGVPGSVVGHQGNNEDQNAFIRFCNGNVCFNNNLGDSTNCMNCFANGNLRGKYVLSPNTILFSGFKSSDSSICTKTLLFQWNDANNCYRKSYCKLESAGSYGANNCIVDVLVCELNPGNVLGQSFRVGPTFYPEGAGASFWHQPECMNCAKTALNTSDVCRMVFKPDSALLTWDGFSNWNANMRGFGGCSMGNNASDHFATSIDYNFNWSGNSSCINNFPRRVAMQQNGVYGAGIAARAFFGFNCNNSGTSQQETFGSWSHAHDLTSLYTPIRSALRSYPRPQFCNCYQTCCYHFLASQVVGCKWIVTMESSQCAACECVTLHAYKIMTNSCTAD